MNRENVESIYRLSPVQQGMLFLTLYSPGEGVYFEQFNATFGEAFQPAVFQRVWQEAVDRHPILRTSFVWEGLEEPVQVVHRRVEIPFEVLDWRGVAEEEKTARLAELTTGLRRQGFDLVQPPLMRLVVIRLQDDVFRVIWSYHHLILDGWSVGLLMAEVIALYYATVDGEAPPPAQARRPFRDYISWLRQQDLAQAEAYWRKVLAGFTTPTPMGVDRPSGRMPPEATGRDMRSALVPEGETDALKAWARENRLTLSAVVQGAWSLVLSRYSGEEDVVFGVTVSGRPPSLPGVDAMLGCFINTLPLRVRVPGGAQVRGWLQGLQADQVEMRRYEQSPLVQVLGWSDVPRPTPLFESIFVFEGFTETPSEGVFQRTGYPLTLVVGPDRELVLRLDYELERFEPATMVRLLGHLQSALSAFLADPGLRLEEIDILTPEERRQLLAVWNRPDRDFAGPLCLHEIFASQAARSPESSALTFESASLSYRDLDQRANRLAHRLRRLGVGPEVRVGLCVDRSFEMVEGLLGILKAGGAYVPLDPRYPAARLSWIAEDSGLEVLVTTEALRELIPGALRAVVCLDADHGLLAAEPAAAPESGAVPDDLAYVIYTSGSTGRPKGSLVTHRNVARLFAATEDWFHFDAEDVWSLFHSFAFDFSVWEIWGALLYGGRLAVVPYWVSRSPEAFHGLLASERVTVLNQTPSAFRQLVQADGEATAAPLALRCVIFGGEALELSSLAPWFDRHGDERPLLVNMYGITETTVHVTYRPVRRVDLEDAARSPIGEPIPDLAIHLRDRHGNLVPVGVPGEMHVAGAGVARGYLGRPDLTAERFVPDPYGTQPGARLYRSGDLSRRTPDGEVEYLGRIDHQVKIRGFRIELGEIEAAILAHPAVREAVVLMKEGAAGEPRLVAYAVPREEGIDFADLRSALKERLPDYMVPAAFVELGALPLTAHGKVDRRALPEPADGGRGGERERRLPRTPVEELLAGIWCALLEVESVGIDESFFDLGGHSLLATRVVSRIRETLQVEIALRELFEATTIAELAPGVEAVRQAASGRVVPPIGIASRDGELPLSFGQERFWFIDQLQPGSAAYNIPAAVWLRGPLDPSALRRAFEEVARRHEALRTVFPSHAGQASQVILPGLPALPLIDLSTLPGDLREPEGRRLALAETARPFDLARGPLARFTLLRLTAETHLVVVTLHHIVSDGWSMGILIRELGAFYGAFAAGLASPLPELPLQYADFAVWQREWLQGEVLEAQIAYWRERLAGVPRVSDLPTDRPHPPSQRFVGAALGGLLSAEVSRGMAEVGRKNGATPFMVLLAAVGTLLVRHGAQEDLAIGSPIAGRSRVELEGMIGLFLNTLVLRTDLAGDPSFATLLGRVRETTLSAYAHQDVPFERLVDELAPERSLSHTPFFQVLLALQNAPPGTLTLPGITLEPAGVEMAAAKFDLTLDAAETTGGLALSWQYNRDVFDGPTIERLMRHLEILLAGASGQPEQRLSLLPLLTTEERNQLLAVWNRASPQPGGLRCLHEIFAAQAARTPEAVAVSCDGELLTYRQLDERANRLGHYLRRLGAGAETRVGLCMDRSLDLVTGLLGILKAGSAYVPLDPRAPRSRLQWIAEDSGLELLVTVEAMLDQVPAATARATVCLDTLGEALERESAVAPESGAGPENLAYVIYTSGSTGRPKGSLVTHANVDRLFTATEEWFQFGERDVWTLFHSFAFDFSVWEIWGALLHGGRLVVVPYWVSRSPEAFRELLAREGVTVLNQTPSAFRQLVRADAETGAEGNLALRLVIFGGEALDPGSLAPWFARHGDREPLLVNMYGITETTVHVSYRPMSRADLEAGGRSPIGLPIPDLAIHLLDRHGALVPVGAPGEINVAGAGLARGYLGRPELTAERFVPDPFGEAGDRLYRSGDLARRLPDGDVEYLGRIDLQVKIRGFRIELGEIEAGLATHPSVREAVVVALDQRLVAYVVGADGPAAAAADLRDHLATTLPDYMIPAVFMGLDALPLNANGKVDRKALPVPDPDRSRTAGELEAPRTPVEEMIAGFWSEVLGIAEIGRDDNFFELGGHSLLATRVHARLRDAFAVDLALRDLFEAATVSRLATLVETARAQGGGAVEPIEPGIWRVGEPQPVSFAQERLWFLDQLDPGTRTYNLAMGVRLIGRLDVPALVSSLDEIVRRHAALRTTFAARQGSPAQIVGAPSRQPMPVVDLSSLPAAAGERAVRSAVAAHAGEPFDLARGPLLRALLVRLSDGDHVVSLTAHHIIFDGWSIGVLVGELGALYAASVEERPSPLPELAGQYVDFARWQRRWLEGDAIAGQLAYWREQLAAVPALQLPTDRPRPSLQSFRGSTQGFVLSPELSAALRTLSRQSGATAFMTVLAAFQVLLGRHSGQEDFAVGSPVAGRNRKELEPLIGFFVNTLVLRAGLAGASDFRALLEQVRRTALDAYGHQDVPFEKVVQELAPERNLSYSPLFQVLLAFQNAPTGSLDLPGLTLAPLAEEFTTSKFDISLTVFDSGPQIFGQWVYSTALFEEATIRRWAGHFQTLLEGLTADPGRRLAELPLLTAAERDQVLLEWNRPPADYPEEGPEEGFVHRMFEAQAGRTPDAVAVVFEAEALSYRQLNERANRFAGRLRDLGVGPESVVGISAERSLELVVGLLGILKTGGAYLPLDPGLPADRLTFMMADAGIELLLTQERLLPGLPVGREGLGIVALDGAGEGTGDAANADVPVLAANAAYVIYTSGSTGQPKGVIVSHGALGNRLQYARAGDVREEDAFLQKTTIGFDVSLLEIFAPLVVGGRTVLARPGGQQDPAYLVKLIQEEGITYTSFPPTLLSVLFEQKGFDRCTSLRTVITGGETVPAGLPGQFYAVLPGADLLNRYGPTETTISVTSWLCERAGTPRTLPIGRPTAKARVYLLDRELQPVPAGIVGEIFLGGLCVARGYLRHPALTGEKFVPDPFSGESGGRLYRPGDLARYRPDGAIEFAGRVDSQVKIRGFRVELGEIETALARHPAVREVAVVDLADGSTRSLAAYMAFHPGEIPGETELRGFLAGTLPAYMVPAAFVTMAALPLSPTGKVDRKTLPAPGLRSVAVDFVPPRTVTEERLAAMWAALLSREVVGVHDGFFDLGGHSLLATQVISRVRESFGVELPLRLLFERPTVAALAEAVEAALDAGSGAVAPPLVPVARGEDLPLSFAQQRLWFLEQLQPGTSTYNMPSAVRFRGPLDVDALRRSLREVVRRHEALRTTFAVRGGAPVQAVAAELRLELPVIDLRWIAEDKRETALRRLAGEESRRPFDLAAGPLLRATLLRSGDEEHVALLTMHHIVADGWSMGVLIRELGALYPAFLAGEPSPLPELAVQYGDFAVWQRRWLQGEVLAAQLDYWRRVLTGLSVLQLPTDRPRPAVQQFRGADEPLAFGPEVSRAALELGRRQGATPYMTLLAGFQALLHRYTGQADVIVGGTVAGRDRGELEPLIGFFVNTLAMRTDLSRRPGFRELIDRVREIALGALSHQDLPFEKLVEELQPERDLSRSPLFQVVFQFQQAVTTALELPGLTLSPIEGSSQSAKFDIVLNLRGDAGGLFGGWKFNTDLFDRATLARMSRHFETLLASAAADPELALAELPILSEAERRQLGLDGGAVVGEALPGPSLHAIFAAQAARWPEAVAVTCDGEGLSYRELDGRANRLAHHLIGLGVAPGDLVGLCLERSMEMVVAILGVLKAGGAYVPLDPAYPRERLAFMLADSRVPVLLAEETLAGVLPETGAATRVVLLDRDRERIAAESSEAPDVEVSAGHPAYVIYTSGSTGRPKGVVVRHGNALRLFTATQPWFDFGPEDVWTLFHSYAFDFSVWELWGALLHGGRLVVVPFWVSRSPEAFYELLARERVTVLNQTPSAFRQLIWAEGSALGGAAPDLALRYVVFGGEALEPASLAPWFERHGDQRPRLINMYGITETTVHVTYRPIGWTEAAGSGSVIGRPIPDLGIYLLDAESQPLPVGIPGEIHVGGPGLALGYLGRPELTAERFVPNPYGDPGSRLYRSGDLARRLGDGDLEYLGRIDHQVKIRGFRIELGEIEAALVAHPAVREAVVLAREDGAGTGERRLVAYVVADGLAPALAELREALAGRLPDYMLPSALMVLDQLPLTANGKVDRKALPAPEMAPAGLAAAHVAPGTDPERFLAGLWQEVLKVPQVGVHDDFFALGGSSITGAVLVSRLQEKLREIVHVVVIFDYPTIAEMAAYLVDQHPEGVARLFGREALGDAGRRPVSEEAAGDAELAVLRRVIRPLAPQERAAAKNPPALFVLSPPRSGSTLMRVMLGGHPRLFSPPELELLSFNTLRERRAAFSGRDAFWLEGVIRAVMEVRGCGAEEAEALVAECEREGLTTLEFYGRLQGWLGDRMLVDKTPSYALDPAILRRAEEGFEEPRYIHLIRHPLGMIHSFEEAKLDQLFFRYEHPFSRRQLAELIWRESHENIAEFLRGVPAARQHWVRFEDLLREPEAILRGICEFLGIDFHPDMAEPYKEKSARMTDGPHVESRMLGDVKFHQYKGVESRVAERWRESHALESLAGGTRELAARLGYDVTPEERAERWSPIPAVLVGLQPGGSKPPLFLVHPLSGELFLYRHLVAALGSEQPVYGFQAVGFATDEAPLATVEEMAAVYVGALLSFQPRGPYQLAGSSLGGLIAFEMARQLRSQGREVAFLALLDSPDPARFLRQEEDADGQAELSILQHVAQGAPGVSIEQLSALHPEERLRLIVDQGRAAGILATSFGLPELRRLVRVVRANRAAVRAYEPRPCETHLFYVRAAEGLGDDAVWTGLALGGSEVLDVPGSHLSMHFPPHAEILAARLRECVAQERTGKNRES
jgi:amino acid adenylation domain-containing protein